MSPLLTRAVSLADALSSGSSTVKLFVVKFIKKFIKADAAWLECVRASSALWGLYSRHVNAVSTPPATASLQA
jgi:hypothetical protein